MVDQFRRSFLGVLAAFFAAPLAAFSKQVNTPTDRVRVFRLREDKWLECRPQDLRKGDWHICIGIDEDSGELWACEYSKAASDWEPNDENPNDPHGQTWPEDGKIGNLLKDLRSIDHLKSRLKN